MPMQTPEVTCPMNPSTPFGHMPTYSTQHVSVFNIYRYTLPSLFQIHTHQRHQQVTIRETYRHNRRSLGTAEDHSQEGSQKCKAITPKKSSSFGTRMPICGKLTGYGSLRLTHLKEKKPSQPLSTYLELLI
ncbi:hypothetical protein JHK85_010851 [Glycine max]|nr:hypothetical protein JHK85_010851 [Glycine max]KAG5066826.1 hypothetical protein JHK86_010557 [Glycine max]